MEVLIVPFMELKLKVCSGLMMITLVLIVPFMELKPKCTSITLLRILRLNRTFYGIETLKTL